MCTVLLPPGVNPIAVKYIISQDRVSVFVNIATDEGSAITEYTPNVIKLTKAGCLPRRTESWRKDL